MTGGCATTTAASAQLTQRRGVLQQVLLGAALGTVGRGASTGDVRMAGSSRSTSSAGAVLLPGVVIGDRLASRTGINWLRNGDRLALLMAASGQSLASSAYCRHCQGID